MSDRWYDEVKQYNFNRPGFSSGTGKILIRSPACDHIKTLKSTIFKVESRCQWHIHICMRILIKSDCVLNNYLSFWRKEVHPFSDSN